MIHNYILHGFIIIYAVYLMFTLTKDLAMEVNFDAAELNIMQLWRIHFMSAKNASVDPYLNRLNEEIFSYETEM